MKRKRIAGHLTKEMVRSLNMEATKWLRKRAKWQLPRRRRKRFVLIVNKPAQLKGPLSRESDTKGAR